MIDRDRAKRLRQRIETMNKLRGRPLTDVERLANLRRAFDEEDAMDKDHAKRVLEHQEHTAKKVTELAEDWVGRAIELLDDLHVNDNGSYSDPWKRLEDLSIARGRIATAISLIKKATWPTPAPRSSR